MKSGLLNWIKKSFLIISWTCLVSNGKADWVDLEADPQDFVLETKQIRIPGFPHAFNPSIVQWQGKILMSFRVIPDPRDSFHSEIGLVWLDQDFEIIAPPQILSLRDHDSAVPCRAEDARLIASRGCIWVVYTDNPEPRISRGGFRMHIAPLSIENGQFVLGNIERFTRFENESSQVREKNWVPFNWHDCLLFAYSLVPHKILMPIWGSGQCDTLSSNANIPQWNWGTLRGGTPALLIRKNEYLAFFHSSIKMPSQQSDGANITHYFMGAYTFSSQPPFEIQRISPQPIIGKGFYNGPVHKPYWHPLRVVFPGGFIMDNDYIYLAYGRQDHEIWVAKLDRRELLKDLAQVRQM
jgi:predicted GH43/DUF377 family glycosyl hydrolase